MKSASNFTIALFVTAAGLLAACGNEHGASENPPEKGADSAQCTKCHLPEFNATGKPPHAGVRPTTCGICHTQTSWGGARIEHPAWGLTGAHARAAEDRTLAGTEKRVKCFWCHRGEPATFKGTPKQCDACHAEDRERVTNPPHETLTACADCHSTEAWKPATKGITSTHEPSAIASPITDAGADQAAPKATPHRPAPKRPKPPAPSTPTSTAPSSSPPPAVSTVPRVPTPPPDVVTRPSRRH